VGSSESASRDDRAMPKIGARGRHRFVLRLHVGALGHKHVGEAKLACTRRQVKGRRAILRWETEGRRWWRGGVGAAGGAEAGVLGRTEGASSRSQCE
jgi:hypothetical protein